MLILPVFRMFPCAYICCAIVFYNYGSRILSVWSKDVSPCQLVTITNVFDLESKSLISTAKCSSWNELVRVRWMYVLQVIESDKALLNFPIPTWDNWKYQHCHKTSFAHGIESPSMHHIISISDYSSFLPNKKWNATGSASIELHLLK